MITSRRDRERKRERWMKLKTMSDHQNALIFPISLNYYCINVHLNIIFFRAFINWIPIRRREEKNIVKNDRAHWGNNVQKGMYVSRTYPNSPNSIDSKLNNVDIGRIYLHATSCQWLTIKFKEEEEENKNYICINLHWNSHSNIIYFTLSIYWLIHN